MSEKIVIIVSPTGAPIPFRGWDWEAHIDGNEEDGSSLGRTKWDAVRALIDDLEASEDEDKDPEPDESMDGDFDSGMASAGFGTDEDYGFFGGEGDD